MGGGLTSGARWQAVRGGPCGMSRAGWAAREGERWAAGKWCARGLKGGVRAGPKRNAGQAEVGFGPREGRELGLLGWAGVFLFYFFFFSISNSNKNN